MPQIVPLSSEPSILFNITLDGIELNMQTKYNTRYSTWSLDIYDEQQNPLVFGVPLLLGSNVLSPYNLNIGSMVCVDVTGQGEDATSDNLGTDVILVHFNEGELNV